MLKEVVQKFSRVLNFTKKEKEMKINRKETKEEVEDRFCSPLKGRIIQLEKVPDQMFSDKAMGDGFAIEPLDGTVVAPVDGRVIQLYPTNHAIQIQSTNGLEILIHVGVGTEKLKGEGFEAFVKKGDRLRKGQKLLEVHLNYVERFIPSTVTSIIFTNLQEGKFVKLLKEGAVERGEKEIIEMKEIE